MRILTVVLTAALCLAVSGCPKNVNPDTPPPPAGAASSKVGVTCSFKVIASDPDFHRVSVRVDWNDGDTSDWTGMFQSGDTTTVSHVWSAANTYRISAQAKDERGAISLWSNWHEVAIADTVSLPPGSPRAPAGPDSGYTDSVYQFSTLAGDPNGDRIQLQLDWGDGDTSDWGGLVAESTLVTMSHAWLAAGEFSVRARARDEKGLVSDWSAAHVLTISDSLRKRLRMVGPAQSTADSSGFRLLVINDRTTEDTISWLEFFRTPDSAYMREFMIDGNHGTGFPRGPTDPGLGNGDTVSFAPVLIAPNGTQVVELLFQYFFPVAIPAPPHDTLANVCGGEFQLRFSDRSEIEFEVPYP